MTAWVNGALVALDDACVSVLDHGFTVGDGVFETLRVYGGRPFRLEAHLDRLEASSARIGLAPLPRVELTELAPSLGYELEEGTYTLADIAAADEAFTSSSVREVLPVSAVDGAAIPLGDAAPALQAALREVASR